MNIDVYLSKGVSYANMERYEEAKLEFEKVLKITKNNGIALFHLGNIQILTGNRAKGIELFNNAIANGFDDAQVYFSLGLMHEEVDSYAFRIMSLRELGKLDKALELSDYLVNVNDKLSEAHILRATVLEALGRECEAREEKNIAASLGGLTAEIS